MGGTVSEPDWKTDLRDSVHFWAEGDDTRKALAFQALLAHVETAYDRGLMAGRSQTGYRTTRKKREGD